MEKGMATQLGHMLAAASGVNRLFMEGRDKVPYVESIQTAWPKTRQSFGCQVLVKIYRPGEGLGCKRLAECKLGKGN